MYKSIECAEKYIYCIFLKVGWLPENTIDKASNSYLQVFCCTFQVYQKYASDFQVWFVHTVGGCLEDIQHASKQIISQMVKHEWDNTQYISVALFVLSISLLAHRWSVFIMIQFPQLVNYCQESQLRNCEAQKYMLKIYIGKLKL